MTATPTATPTPVAATLKLSPKSLKFSSSPVGITGKPRKLKLVNASKQNVPILIEDATATPPYTLDVALSTCHIGMELAAKANCSFVLTYTASALGKQPGTFSLTDNSQTTGHAVINLSGAGKAKK
jgi:hypothetical protein